MVKTSRFDPFDDFFRGFFVRPVEFGAPPDAPTIRMDVKENAENYIVLAELPGIRKHDIQVKIDGSVVSISAERVSDKEGGDSWRVLRSERYFGKVSRSFQLGQDIDEFRAAAKFTDGVLELALPKKTAATARKVVIE